MDAVFLVIEPDFPRMQTKYHLTIKNDKGVRQCRMSVSSGYGGGDDIPRHYVLRDMVHQMARDYGKEIEATLRNVGAL